MPRSSKKLRADANELIEKALLLRPDLAARFQELKASKEATKRAMADFLPVVKLEGSYNNITFGYQGAQSNPNVSGYYKNFAAPFGGAFLTAHWDLFDGFERVFKLKQRQEEDKVAEQNLRQTQLDTTRDVWTSYNNCLAAAQRVDFAEGFLASAQEFFRSISAASATGLADITDYSQAGSNVSMAQSELATSLADYSTALASLALAMGSSTPSSALKNQGLGAPGEVNSHLLTSEAAALSKEMKKQHSF